MNLIKKIYMKIIKFLSSPKTALILLIHFTVFSVIAVLFPSIESNINNKSYSEIFNNNPIINSFNFQDKFNNNVVLVLLISFCLGILISIYFRLKSEIKIFRNRFNNESSKSSIDNSHFYISEIIKILKKYNYKVSIKSVNNNSMITGERGTLGVFGSILFHLSLIVLCIGIFLSTFASFHGSFNLTEGETFNKFTRLDSGIFYHDDTNIKPVKLISYIPQLNVNGSLTEAAVIEYTNNGLNKIDTTYINKPINLGSKKLYIGTKIGYSPYIEIINKNGEKVFHGFLRLANTQSGNTIYNKDFIYLDTTKIEFEFLPDLKTKSSNNLVNAILIVKINNDQRVFTAAGVNKEVDNYSISYYGFRKWVSFDIKDDTGVMVIFWAALLGSIGLAMRLLFVKKKIVVNLYKKDKIFYDIAISTEKFFILYKDELQQLSEQIEKSLEKYINQTDYEKVVQKEGMNSTC